MIFGGEGNQGFILYKDGSEYTGQLRHFRAHGAGELKKADGKTVTGTWHRGRQVDESQKKAKNSKKNELKQMMELLNVK